MAKFKVGDKVKVRNMVMPGEVLSGPHASFGASRWLVRKAAGNVSLLREDDVSEWQAAPAERIAEIISTSIYGTGMGECGPVISKRIAGAAEAIVAEFGTKLPPLNGEGTGWERVSEPRALAVGDRIRILVDDYELATVHAGDVLTVRRINGGSFSTNAPRALVGNRWVFSLRGEGTGWERA